jgi:hypothetical protein
MSGVLFNNPDELPFLECTGLGLVSLSNGILDSTSSTSSNAGIFDRLFVPSLAWLVLLNLTLPLL